ncbi:MAG: hypothetical protein ACWA5Q_05145 [bacterium]
MSFLVGVTMEQRAPLYRDTSGEALTGLHLTGLYLLIAAIGL